MDSQVQRSKARSVVGVLDDSTEVEGLLSRLNELGVQQSNISVMMREGSEGTEPVKETQSAQVTSGAATGAALGGLLGGLAGWMIAVGAIGIPGVLVPGVGLVFGAGTLASLLTGLAVGAAAGGLVGALLSVGVPEAEAKRYEKYVERGRSLVTVQLGPGIDEGPVLTAFEESGAYDVRVYEAPSASGVQTRLASHTPVQAAPIVMPAQVEAVSEDNDSEHATLPGEAEVGEVAAETDTLGTGAAGGYGDGEARGETPGPEPTGEVPAGTMTEADTGEVEHRTVRAENDVQDSDSTEPNDGGPGEADAHGGQM